MSGADFFHDPAERSSALSLVATFTTATTSAGQMLRTELLSEKLMTRAKS